MKVAFVVLYKYFLLVDYIPENPYVSYSVDDRTLLGDTG